MNLLNENNPVHIFLNIIGDIVLANLLFLLCCIPIVTIGPALTALYHCMLRTVKGNNNGTVKTFFRAFRDNFRQSLAVWLVIGAAALLAAVNIHFLESRNQGAGRLLFYLSGVVLTGIGVLCLYIFPVIAAFSNTTKNLVKNALIFAISHLPSTLVMAIITCLPLYMTFKDIKLLPLYVFCWFFFGFGLTAYINSRFFYRMFKPYLEES